MTIEITKSGFDRTVRDFEQIAGEPLKVDFFSGTFYAFGSELATLRLLKKYRNSEKARADYSKNLSSFYFSLETPNLTGEFSS